MAEANPNRWAIWAAVGAGTFLNVLDNSMMTVSLPTITRELNSELATTQWVVTGYMLVISSLLLTGGRLADVYGRKRLYITGMVIFVIASTLAGFAADPLQLIAFRVLQGIGSALVQGIGTAIVVSASLPPSAGGRWASTRRRWRSAGLAGRCSVESSPTSSAGAGSSGCGSPSR